MNRAQNVIKNGVDFKGMTEALFPLALTVFTAFFIPNALIEGTKQGLAFFSFSILPSVFPFMILSDYLLKSRDAGAFRPITVFLSNILSLSETGAKLLLIGLFCGFPIGAVSVRDAYEKSLLQKEEAERLLSFANNPSPGFVIGGIGLGILKHRAAGLILFFSVALSAFCVSRITSQKRKAEVNSARLRAEKDFEAFSPAFAIQKAAFSCLTVGGFTVFFRMIAYLLAGVPMPKILSALFLCFLEIGSAVQSVGLLGLAEWQKAAVMAFALGFSGISVFWQVRAFLEKSNLSAKRYLPLKLIQGMLASVFTGVLYFVFG